MTTVRLAASLCSGGVAAERYEWLTKDMTTVRLATLGPPEALAKGLAPGHAPPALLCSYAYLAPFLRARPKFHFRDWALDSGAFTAHASGKHVDLQQYVDTCLRLMASDKQLTEIFALDVIGNPDATLKNTEEMWRQGVPAIPCYHLGGPEDYLLHIAKEYPKIALGGVARKKGDLKIRWAKECFARVWPKRVHGFGYGAREAILAVPWHSVDASSWEFGPCAVGRWKAYGGKLSVRGGKMSLRAEVDYYLKIEREAQQRWAKEMALLEAEGPSLRFAIAALHERRIAETFKGETDAQRR